MTVGLVRRRKVLISFSIAMVVTSGSMQPSINPGDIVLSGAPDDGGVGLMGFGSGDPEGFTPDMGPELVGFMARVTERLAGRLQR